MFTLILKCSKCHKHIQEFLLQKMQNQIVIHHRKFSFFFLVVNVRNIYCMHTISLSELI